MGDETLYTVEEVATRLRVTRATVYNWMRSGRLGYVHAGPRRRRVPESALRAFMLTGVPDHAENDEKNGSPQLVAVAD